jgi:serine kinase of HPr protein (carbohydrate metabolism regulator)
VASYYIKNGNEIIISRNTTCSINDISAFLVGSAFGALLHQRHLLPLHASTVVHKNKCFVFMGISGVGKSTLAAALIGNGATLVADDISVIDFSATTPRVIPAFPAIKIWKSTLQYLNIDSSKLKRVRGELEKYYVPVSKYADKACPIDKIFVLTTHDNNEVLLKPLEGIEKFMAVKNHTYLFRSLPKTGLEINHFNLVNQLISCVSINFIARPNSVLNTADIITSLQNHIDN